MKLDVFEGFRRINAVVIALILIIGSTIAYNQTAYINVDPIYHDGNECVSSYSARKYLDRGVVYYDYCFDQEYEYESQKSVAEAYTFSETELASFEDKLFKEWLLTVAKGLGSTLLACFAYYIMCRVIKFIALGFLQKQ
jgi:hypothetical protein